MFTVFNNYWADLYWSSYGRFSAFSRSSSVDRELVTADCSHMHWHIPDPFCFYPKPLNIIVFTPKHRRWTEECHSRLWTEPIPKRSLVEVADKNYVVSPEFLFMEMARRLDLPQTIALGYELCGTYSINPITHEAMFNIPPATSSARIRQFVNDAGSVHGAEKARRAARYVHDNSASPMETALHMHFQLPGVLHGFELPHSELNKSVKLNDKAKSLYPRNSCRCDFYYSEIHQAIEYNGAFHDFQEKDDFKRAAALEIMGYHSMILSFETYDNLWALGEVAYNIAKKHGIKRHHGKVAPTRGRLELHASLKRYYLGLDRTAPEWMKDEALINQVPIVPD